MDNEAMTTNTRTTNVRSIYQVNSDPTDIVSGAALLTYIVSVAARRDHLRNAILSVQFSADRGIGILVGDAGQREHLANALGFDRKDREERLLPEGVAHSRVGTIEGVVVHIWNLEP